MLVTTEPATITRYGRSFAAQFGKLLTSQEEHFLPHPDRIYSHTGNLWFYGKSIGELDQESSVAKSGCLSTVCSAKEQIHTRHSLRNNFTRRLKMRMPEMELFGKGVRYVKNKHEAIAPYRFHLAIENHVALHHWTEKLADPLLAYSVPIYSGCPNLGDYFPEESYIEVDITNFEESAEKIRKIIHAPGEYERRLSAVKEARRRVLNEYNLPAMIERIVLSSAKPQRRSPKKRHKIINRKQMRSHSVIDLSTFLCWRLRNAVITITK